MKSSWARLVALLLLIIVLVNACLQAPPESAAPTQPEVSPLLGNLGSHSHALTTDSEQVQKYLDQSLHSTYRFNYAEAIRF